MGEFRYTAVAAGGRRVSGVVSAASPGVAVADLERQGLTPVEVSPAWGRPRVGKGVSARTLAMTYSQLGDQLAAGVPLIRGLRMLGARKSQPRIADAFGQIAEQVAGGEDLSEAMGRWPGLFAGHHIAMVRAGEKGGFLDGALHRLGELVERQAELRSKLVGAMVYPAVLVTLGVVVLAVVFGVFLPKFEVMFERVERLPMVTVVVFALARAVSDYGLVVLAMLGAAAAGGVYASRREDVRRAVAVGLTRGPVIGPITRSVATARFCRMLGTMLAGGVPLLPAMRVARDAAGNLLLGEAIDRAADRVQTGEAMTPALRESGLIEEDVLEMLAMAESANNLDGVLLRIAETIERRVDRLLTNAIRLVEPLLIGVIALLVGTIAAALLLPLVSMSSGF